jgi:hypothetical protein
MHPGGGGAMDGAPVRSARDAQNHDLCLAILGVRVRITCADPRLRAVLTANFGQMRDPAPPASPDLDYRVLVCAGCRASLVTSAGEHLDAQDVSDLVHLLEKELTVDLQLRCAHLLFLHAAAVEYAGGAWVIAGESGAGKSTIALALVQSGCDYLTDELSAVDVAALEVYPYQHALCLKQAPPAPCPFMRQAMRLETTIHVPAQVLPCTPDGPEALAGLVLLERRSRSAEVRLRRLGAAEAAARLYTVTLNPLAHPHHGLDGVVALAERLPCFGLQSGELSATCARVLEVMCEPEKKSAPQSRDH